MKTHAIPNRRVFNANCKALGYRLETAWIKVGQKAVRVVRAWCDADPYFPEVRATWDEDRGAGILKAPDHFIPLV